MIQSGIRGSVVQGYFNAGFPSRLAGQNPPAIGASRAVDRLLLRNPVTSHPPQSPSVGRGPGALQPSLHQVGIKPNNVTRRFQTHTPVLQHGANRSAVELPQSMGQFGSGNGQPLPATVQQNMEAVFGVDFSDVQIHVGTQASSIGALAFTHGARLYFAPGQYDPFTRRGQQLLGHELAHVVQQRSGRATNPFGSGIALIHDPMLEAEAERMGLRAANYQPPMQARMAVQAKLSGSKPAGALQSMSPPSQRGIIQRVGVNLQSYDPVVKKLIAYSKNTLGITDPVFSSLEAAARTVKRTENLYLYGHGGNSSIDLEEHDLFARINMQNLANDIAENINFPKDYVGSIYLIGCKTISLVSALKTGLKLRTGLNIKVRGTTELLQTTKTGGMVVRDQTKDSVTIKSRESNDMQRHFYDTLRQLRNMRRDAIETLRNPVNLKAGIIKILEQEEFIDATLKTVDEALEKLAGASTPTLLGRKEGLETVQEAFQDAKKIRNDLKEKMKEFFALDKEMEEEDRKNRHRSIANGLRSLLIPNKNEINDTILVWGIVVNSFDDPDVLKSTPFTLDTMWPKRRKRKKTTGSSNRVSLGELSTKMNIFEFLDPDRIESATIKATKIAKSLKKVF